MAYLQNDGTIAQPPQPEALRIYYMMRNFDLPPVSGGLFDQPYVLMRELQVCHEEDHRHLAKSLQGTP